MKILDKELSAKNAIKIIDIETELIDWMKGWITVPVIPVTCTTNLLASEDESDSEYLVWVRANICERSFTLILVPIVAEYRDMISVEKYLDNEDISMSSATKIALDKGTWIRLVPDNILLISWASEATTATSMSPDIKTKSATLNVLLYPTDARFIRRTTLDVFFTVVSWLDFIQSKLDWPENLVNLRQYLANILKMRTK